MNNPGLRSVLKWGLNNSGPSSEPAENKSGPTRSLNPEALASLLGGPSEADLMVGSMTTAQSDVASLQDRVTALDNFEQLIEGIDNANNMEPLGLWTPLVTFLGHEEADLRKMAASCIGTAVQNNVKAQEKVKDHDVIPTLVKLATEDPNDGVRRKAIRAISCSIRNYQPGLDSTVEQLPLEQKKDERLDASDMISVDRIIEKLRQKSEIMKKA